jgi:hypothetical protein
MCCQICLSETSHWLCQVQYPGQAVALESASRSIHYRAHSQERPPPIDVSAAGPVNIPDSDRHGDQSTTSSRGLTDMDGFIDLVVVCVLLYVIGTGVYNWRHGAIFREHTNYFVEARCLTSSKIRFRIILLHSNLSILNLRSVTGCRW